MNKHCYRIIFNKTLGRMVVVSERSKSQGKSSEPSNAQHHSEQSIEQQAHQPLYPSVLSTLKQLQYAILLALGSLGFSGALHANHPTKTQIIADKTAPKIEQPVIIATANGLTQVNIQTPSQAGVSKNQYSQFDVGQQGAILNNSRTHVKTQLAGFVEANPYLARGEAKVILNQVNSNNPSQLKGYVEVAGKRAEVVIANPSGIQVNGGGFINAQGAVLTTGQAQFDGQGNITHYDISQTNSNGQQGKIQIDGKGFNNSEADYTKLISQYNQLNAQVFSGQGDLEVQTGTQLDVSKLGGMYAGKIRLVGTKQGVGVHNAGDIHSLTSLHLDHHGQLTNTGSLNSKEQLSIQAQHINNSGTINSSRDKIILNSSQLDNSGLIASHGELQATHQQQIQNTGAVSAGQLNLQAQTILNKGQIEQTGTGQLHIQSQTLNNQQQAVIGHSLYTEQKVSTVNLAQAPSTAQTGSKKQVVSNQEQSSTTPSSTTTSVTPAPVITGDGKIIAEQIDNQGQKASIITNDAITIKTAELNNQDKSSIVSTQIDTSHIKNHDSRIQQERIHWQLKQLDNQQGQIIAKQAMSIHTEQALNNQQGILASSSDITISTPSHINNQQGIIQGQNITLNTHDLNNNAGTIISKETLSLDSQGHLSNQDGQIISQGQSDIQTQDLRNQGMITSHGNLTIHSQQLNNQGVIHSHSNTQIHNKNALNNAGQISSQGDLSLHTGTLQQNQTGQIVAGLDSEQKNLVKSAQALTIHSDGSQQNQGKLIASGQMEIQGSELDLQQSQIQAQNLSMLAKTGQINLKQAQVIAEQNAQLNTKQQLNNEQGTLQANHIDLTTATLSNQKGVILHTGQSDFVLNTGHIDNQAGYIGVQAQNMTLNSQTAINNTQGKIIHVGTGKAQISAKDIDNRNTAQLISHGQLSITGQNSIDNQAGEIKAQTLKLLGDGVTVDNQKGLIQAKQIETKIKNLVNTQGKVQAEQLNLNQQQDYHHQQGDQLNVNQLSITTAGNFINSSVLSSKDLLHITAQNIDNQKTAQLISENKTELTAQQNISNRGLINAEQSYLTAGQELNNLTEGRIYGTHLAIKAQTLNNNPDVNSTLAPVIAARQRLDIGVQQLNNLPNAKRANTFNKDFNYQAQLLSNGALHIGGDLDENHHATGQAELVLNKGATIQSLGEMSINANSLQNLNADFQLTDDSRRENITQYTYDKGETIYLADQVNVTVGGARNDYYHLHIKDDPNKSYTDFDQWFFTETLKKLTTDESDPSRIIAGESISFNLNNFTTDKSQIIAGDKIHVSGAVANVDSEPNTLVSEYIYTNVTHTTYQYAKKKRNISGHYDSSNVNTVSATLPLRPKNGTPYKIKILDLGDNNANVYDTAITVAHQKQVEQAIDIDKVAISGNNSNPNLNTTLSNHVDSSTAVENKLNPSQVPQEIRSQNNTINIAQSALYRIQPQATSDYLVATDPAFTNGKAWLGSDYMLKRLSHDPNHLHKRLGDGYYEQGFIREQIMSLTGKRYLADYRRDEQQYQALMDNGLAFAQKFNLRAGVALTSEQMAQLTTDIVWLVKQDINYTDEQGQTRTQSVLVPRVYIRSNVADLTGDGSLISARNINMDLTGDLNNQGHIVAQQNLNVQADNINNQHGALIKGNFVQLNTAHNINNIGATISADSAMSLTAGQDIKNISTSYHNQSQIGKSSGERTGLTHIAQIYVGDGLKDQKDEQGNPLLTLSVNADGQYIAGAGHTHNAGGNTVINAQQGIDLQAIKTGHRTDSVMDDNNYFKYQESQDVGSSITGTGHIIATTEGNITGVATTIASEQNSVALVANGTNSSIDIKEGRHTQDVATAYHIKSKGILSKKSTQDRYDYSSNNTIASQIDGKQVLISATQDANLTAVQAISDEQTTIQAGRNVNITGANNTTSLTHQHETKKSGFAFSAKDGLASVGYAKNKNNNQLEQQSSTITSSLIASKQGSTTIIADNQLNINASKVQAGQDIHLQGKQVELTAGSSYDYSQQSQQQSRSGFGVGVTYDPKKAFKTAYDRGAGAGQFSNNIIGKASAHGMGMLQGTMALAPVQITGGKSKASQTQINEHKGIVSSELTAVGNITVVATDNSIITQGAKISAEQNTTLLAKQNIQLGYATQQQSQTAQQQNKGFSLDTRNGVAPLGTFKDQANGNNEQNSLVGTQVSVGGKLQAVAQTGQIDIIASQVVANQDVDLITQQGINIVSASSHQQSHQQQNSKAIGGAVLSDTEYFMGQMRSQNQQDSQQSKQVRSQVGSLQGNVNMMATDGQYYQQSSDVIAKKDLNITAKSIKVEQATNLLDQQSSSKDKKIGTFSKISSPIITAIQSAEQASKSKADERTQALQGLAAVANGYQAYNAISNGGALVKAEVGLGVRTASQSQTIHQSSGQNNTLTGENIKLTSTDGDIDLNNTQLKADQTIDLNSSRDIHLTAGQSQHQLDGQNKSAGVAVGAGVSVGVQTGIYIYAEANQSKGKQHQDSLNHEHTTLNSKQLNITSKGDTTLKGAVANADRIDVNVGKTLTLTSVQDYTEQDNKQSSVGGRVQVSLGTAWEVSGNYAQSKGTGSSKQVNTQTALNAGQGGFHITAGAVDLQAGAINSQADKNKNELITNKLTFSNMDNYSSYDVQSVSVNAGYGSKHQQANPNDSTAFQNTKLGQYFANTAGKQGLSSTPSLPQREQDKSHSTTYATLSDSKIIIAGQQTNVDELGIHSNSATANQQVNDLPDLAKIIEKQQIVQGATSDIGSAINTYTEQQRKEAEQAKKQAEQLYQQQLAQQQDGSLARYQALSPSEQQQELRNNSVAYQQAEQQYTSWSVGGDKNRALQTVSTIITSSLGGQGANQVVTQAVSPYTAYAIGQYFKNNDSLNRQDGGNRAGEGSKSHLLAHGLLAAATSYATGQSVETITATTLSTMGAEALAPKLSQYLYGAEKVADLTAEQKQTISNVLGTAGLVTGVVTAQATGADSISSVSAGQQVQGSVQNAVENNRNTPLENKNFKQFLKNDVCKRAGVSLGTACDIYYKQTLEKETQKGINFVQNTATGAIDAATFGATAWVRDIYDIQGNINKQSFAYQLGDTLSPNPVSKVKTTNKAINNIKQISHKAKANCATGTVCFTAGTFIETSEGLKTIETFTGGELIWTRNDITLEYGYRPVIATKATPEQPIFQVTVKNHQGDIETLETTAEHPFWIKDSGWLKASLLEQGMILLDRNNQEVEVLSQFLIPNHTDTVYNIEVDGFHTYHVGRLGVWVHNDNCCDLNIGKNSPDFSGTTHKNITNRTGNGDIKQQEPSRSVLKGFTVDSFNLTGSKAYKQLKTDKERKEFISHYTRQLKRQEEAINSLSPDEFISAVEAYKEHGRESSKAQTNFTNNFKKSLQKSIENSLHRKNPNLSSIERENYAKQRTKEITDTLAALHDPDQVVGGFFSEIKHMGNRQANSAIGGSWSGKRVNQLLESAKRLKSVGASKMNISLTTK